MIPIGTSNILDAQHRVRQVERNDGGDEQLSRARQHLQAYNTIFIQRLCRRQGQRQPRLLRSRRGRPRSQQQQRYPLCVMCVHVCARACMCVCVRIFVCMYFLTSHLSISYNLFLFLCNTVFVNLCNCDQYCLTRNRRLCRRQPRPLRAPRDQPSARRRPPRYSLQFNTLSITI
jgi:hypothetical protein